MLRLRFLGAVPLIVGTASFGQIVIPGADGSDGAFNPTCAPTPCTVTVDLSQAVTGVWDMDNSANAGKGVYDPDKWAVVFKYSSVNVSSGVTVAFSNHPSRAPVVWLVSGDVTIAGVVSLNGKAGHAYNASPIHAEPGPGGFRGGVGREGLASSSAGLGPGGGQFSYSTCPTQGSYGAANAGSFGAAGQDWRICIPQCYGGSGTAGPTYGNSPLFPLIGGSGGSGAWSHDAQGGGGGGGGGGALLIATAAGIALNGQIECRGGDTAGPGCGYVGAGGSGGGVRLIGDTITGTGSIRADGGVGVSTVADGGAGRIRVEANDIDKTITSSPPYSGALPNDPIQIWPPDDVAPSVAVTEVQFTSPDGSPQPPVIPPSDPRSNYTHPEADVSIDTVQPATIVIAATNVPASWEVKVRIVPRFGQDTTADATCASGNDPCTQWTAQAAIPRDMVSAIQVRAKFPGT